jgi:hypothetical protein
MFNTQVVFQKSNPNSGKAATVCKTKRIARFVDGSMRQLDDFICRLYSGLNASFTETQCYTEAEAVEMASVHCV